MDFSTDDYFGTLGGSLMKDLLADLQVDEGDFSLDQLEKELATLDAGPPQFQTQTLPTLDAASFVVAHAQERSGSVPSMVTSSALSQGVDAWSLSLQNFTAMSLQDDFLAADSARKKQQGSAMPLQPSILEGAEDYDVAEKHALTPPPGLGVPPSAAASIPPKPAPFPKTPQNSVILGADEANTLKDVLGITASTALLTNEDRSKSPYHAPPVEAIPSQGQSIRQFHVPPQAIPMPDPSIQSVAPGVKPAMPIQVVMPPQQADPQDGMPFPLPQMIMTPPELGQPMVVATPAMRGTAWQTPSTPIPQPFQAFCNPHPSAQPIPATMLETEYMTARDIAYVVHSILKPVLAEGVSESDYYVQFLRRIGGQASASKPKTPKDAKEELQSRASKSKKWSSEKGTLGHVTKSNVARPRALIATPVATTSEQDLEQKQRATLWKSRIYCDQAYQSYQTVVDIWRSAPPGAVPPQVQKHLVQLMKCMGITHHEKQYRVDGDSLLLLIRLGKGRTLTARALEQALLPPKAVQSLIPVLLDSLLKMLAKKSGDDKSDDFSIERLFRAIAGVVQKLNSSSDMLLQCLEAIQRNGKTSLGSPARMECAHTLLRIGAAMVSNDPSEEKRVAWRQAEAEFMNFLQAF